MISFRMIVPVIVMIALPSIAVSQTKDNKAIQQLNDVNKSSQDAARTQNLEQSKAKSNQNIDTASKGAVRAPAPSTQTKAERDAAAIKLLYKRRNDGTLCRRAPPPSPGSAPAETRPASPPIVDGRGR